VGFSLGVQVVSRLNSVMKKDFSQFFEMSEGMKESSESSRPKASRSYPSADKIQTGQYCMSIRQFIMRYVKKVPALVQILFLFTV
jgi:hypothetical protein